jgi:alpha-glucosidase
VFGGPAWSRITEPDGTPGQWYLHLFDVHQPDFNWANPEVVEEFRGILRFWLDRGVDGFRVDVANGLVKRFDHPIEAASAAGLEAGDPSGELPPMWDQDGVHEIYRDWHRVLAGYPGDRLLVAEAWVTPPERLARYVRPDEMNQAFNFDFLLTGWQAGPLRAVIERSLAANGSVGAPTTWVLSNHDVIRHASRLGLPDGVPHLGGIGVGDPQPDQALGLQRARAATLLMLALPGSAYVYQGEELGLPEHTQLPDDVRQDPTWERSGHTQRGRDGCRVPLPWRSDAPGYGFSPTGASWLPQPPSWAHYALDRQVGQADSTYELYRAALRLRRDRGLGLGTWQPVDLGAEVVAGRNGDVLVVANLGHVPLPLPDGARVLLASGHLGADGTVPTDVTVWAGT